MSHLSHHPEMSSRLRVTIDGESRDFTDAVVPVGRDPELPLTVPHPDVSRRHAEFRREGDTWVLVDLQSTNGTFIGPRRIDREVLRTSLKMQISFGGVGVGTPVQIEVIPTNAATGNSGSPSGTGPSLQPGNSAPAASLPPSGPPTLATEMASPHGSQQSIQPQNQQGPLQGHGQAPPMGPAMGPAMGQHQASPPHAWQGPPSVPGGQASGPVPVRPDGQLAHGHTVLPSNSPMGRTLTVGRSRSSDVVIDDPLVSRQHATLILGATPQLRDLNSFNGTFVNGRRLQGVTTLNVGDEVNFGNQTFTWTGSNLASKAARSDLTLFAENLTTVVKGGKRLIEGMSFQLGPSSLTAVIGPSGAGKSTLLGALTGLNPATHGHVVWQGTDLYTHYEQLRFQIGLVPQSDIQHPQLTVRQGLNYAAMLRLPPDTTAQERAQRVEQVVGQMQLQRQIDNRIGTQLSGGQRKRVSIATELLTAPPLLFLDEPTSGLDPGLDRDVMHQLRGLADDGRVVMVVTHSVLALDTCDNVLVLAPGGRLAYFGPPAGVLEHFGCRDYPQVFDLLDEPDLWQRIPAPPSRTDTGRLPAVNAPVVQPPLQSMSRQLWTLVRRNLAVTFADRLLLAMLVLMPIVLGGLSRVVQGSNGLGLEDTAGPRGIMDPSEASQRLIILIMAAALMGAAVTIRELIKERAIYQREYAVGLSPGMYLVSKILVLGTACFWQGVLVTFIALVGMPSADGGGHFGLADAEIALAIGLTALVVAVIGLTVSALVTSSEQTMPALVGVVMIQLVLCGGLVPLAGRAVLEQLAWLAPARWGFAASATSVDLNKALGPDETADTLYSHSGGQYVFDLFMLIVLFSLISVAAYFAVRRSATTRH